jgi:hypothetical protein
MIKAIGRVSLKQSAHLEFDNKKCDGDEGIRPMVNAVVSVSRIPYPVSRIPYPILRIAAHRVLAVRST